MVRRRIAWLVAAFGACAVVFGACALYDASLLLPATDGGAADAGIEASALDGATTADADTCMHKRVPPPPTTEDGTENLDFVLAGTRIGFFPNGASSRPHPVPPTSFDVDGVCTCPGPESCKPVAAQQHCDAEGGADDTAGSVISTFAAIDPKSFSDDAVNSEVANGAAASLLRVRSYNGGKNDKQVTMIVYLSEGIQGIQDGGIPPSPPKSDGTDVYTIDPSSLLGGAGVDGGATCEGNDNVCVPLYADTEAYVSNGVLVAHVDFPLTIGAGSEKFVAKLSGSLLAAPLIKDATTGLFRIDDGQVVGRWNTADLLSGLANIHDPITKTDYLCGTSATYQDVKTIACKASDVMANPTADNTGQTCDALSIAMSFSAVQSHLGPLYTRPAILSGACGGNWTDDCSSVK
jgi:hypothetical protein